MLYSGCGALSHFAAAAALCPARQWQRFCSLCFGSLAWRRLFCSLGGLARRLARSAVAALLLLLRQPLLFWPGFGFCGTTVMVVLAPAGDSGCPSRPDSPEPALWQGFPIPADNFPNAMMN